jgi:hypothetical protein
MKKRTLVLTTILFLIFIINIQLKCLIAEEAEINAFIEKSGELPSIKLNKWVPIKIIIKDSFGMNWTDFQERFFNFNLPVKYWFFSKLWDILFSKGGRPVKSFLGYTSLRFTPEIISSNPEGWYARITPNSIGNTTTGIINNITLELKIDEAPIDYSIIVRINCSRYDTFGKFYGTSYINIPVKAQPNYFIKMELSKEKDYSGLNEIKHFQIKLTNKGFYKDTYFFYFDHSNEIICNVDNQVIVLEPRETKTVNMNVLSPVKIIDFGTPYVIDVYTSSIGDNSSKLIGSYVLITRGFHISPLVVIIAIPILIFLIIVVVVLFFYFKSKNLIKQKF